MRKFESLFEPNATKSANNSFRIWLALLSDCDVENWPSTTDGTMLTSPLRAGKEWVNLDVTAKSVDPKVTKDNEADLEGFITLTPILEGISGKALQWIYDHNGLRVVCLYQRCSDGQRFLAGSPCSYGLLLTYTEIGAQDGGLTGIKLLLKGNKCIEPIYAASFPLSPTPPPGPEPEPVDITIRGGIPTNLEHWGGWNSDGNIQNLYSSTSLGSVMHSVILIGDETYGTSLMPEIVVGGKTYYPVTLTIPNDTRGMRTYYVEADIVLKEGTTVIDTDGVTIHNNINEIIIAQNIVAIDATETFILFPICYIEAGVLLNNHALFIIRDRQ